MYKSVKLVPADGSALGQETPRQTNMVSLDGYFTITFGKNGSCLLATEKGRYHLKLSDNGKVYYTTIGKWYVCFNGAAISWKSL